MTELRDRLRREMAAFQPATDGYESTLRKMHTRQRNRRVAVGALALAIFSVTGFILWSAFGPLTPGHLLGLGDAPPNQVCEADGVCREGPKVVLKRLSVAGHEYKLVAYRSSAGLCVDFGREGQMGGGCGLDLGKRYISASVGQLWRPLVTEVSGVARPQVVTVTVRLADGRRLTTETVSAPKRLGVRLRFFALALEGMATIRSVVAKDAGGQLLGNPEHQPPLTRVSPPPQLAPPGLEPIGDAHGNVIGYVSQAEDIPFFRPGADASIDEIRSAAGAPFTPGRPDVQRWWQQRPSSGEGDHEFIEWWERYPIEGPEPTPVPSPVPGTSATVNGRTVGPLHVGQFVGRLQKVPGGCKGSSAIEGPGGWEIVLEPDEQCRVFVESITPIGETEDVNPS